MTAAFREETLKSLAGYYNDKPDSLNWPSIFSLPLWLNNWWSVFGSDYKLFLHSLWQDEKLIGIAPLMRREDEAYLLGSADVCDYLDFVVRPGFHIDFMQLLIPELQRCGVARLILNAQRPDAVVFQGYFSGCKSGPGCGRFQAEDYSYELSLPVSWEDYLAALTKKQRHEVRRKLSRLEDNTENYRYRVISGSEAVINFIPEFLNLLRQNPEKEEFLTGQMEQYFRSLILDTARAGLARFGLLEIDGSFAAAVLYFDYLERIYLYNSGYLSQYSALSAGLLSKVFCIKDSLEKQKPVFDFLKGREVYKRRLGGTAIPIYKVTIST